MAIYSNLLQSTGTATYCNLWQSMSIWYHMTSVSMTSRANFVYVNFILDSQLQCMNPVASRNSKPETECTNRHHEFDGGKWKDKSYISQPKWLRTSITARDHVSLPDYFVTSALQSYKSLCAKMWQAKEIKEMALRCIACVATEGQSLTPRIALDPEQRTLVPWLCIASFDFIWVHSDSFAGFISASSTRFTRCRIPCDESQVTSSMVVKISANGVNQNHSDMS